MTAPLSDSQITKLQSRTQAVKWAATLKEVREFRAYCCNIDSDAIMGVAKEPVIIADITPNPVCLGSDIDWDISSSYAPGSTLTAWEVDFGDTTSASGADFPNDTTSGTHTYATTGDFTITITITEGLGKSQISTVEIVVIDCALEIAFPGMEISYTYISTDGDGVFFIDWTDDIPAWVSRNTGLTGDALYVRSLIIKPSTKTLHPLKHILYAATLDGVYHTANGGRGWSKIILPDPSNAEFNDSPAATVDELDFNHVVLDPTNENIIYVLASKEA